MTCRSARSTVSSRSSTGTSPAEPAEPANDQVLAIWLAGERHCRRRGVAQSLASAQSVFGDRRALCTEERTHTKATDCIRPLQGTISYVPLEQMDEAHEGGDGALRKARHTTTRELRGPRPLTGGVLGLRRQLGSPSSTAAWSTTRSRICAGCTSPGRSSVSSVEPAVGEGHTAGLRSSSTTNCSTSRRPTCTTTARRPRSRTPRPSPGAAKTSMTLGPSACPLLQPELVELAAIALTFGQQSWIRVGIHHQYMAGTSASMAPVSTADDLATSKADPSYWAASSHAYNSAGDVASFQPTVNGREHRRRRPAGTSLPAVTSQRHRDKSPKFGCGLGQCGACGLDQRSPDTGADTPVEYVHGERLEPSPSWSPRRLAPGAVRVPGVASRQCG